MSLSPNEALAVDIIKLVAERTPDVFPVAELFHPDSLDVPDWEEISRKKGWLSGGERVLVELAHDTWFAGTGSLAAAMGKCDPLLREQVLSMFFEAFGALL